MTQTPIEKLHERTTIEFPRKIPIVEFRDLLSIITERIPCDFSGFSRGFESIRRLNLEDGESPVNESYTSEFGGTLTRKGVLGASFRCEIRTDYNAKSGPISYVAGISFDTAARDTIEELETMASCDLETMDLVRGQVERYFADSPASYGSSHSRESQKW